MKKYKSTVNIEPDQILERMLRDRRAPLTQSAMNRLLADLTMHIASDVHFLCIFYPRKDALEKDEIHAGNIEKADVMEGTDGERYLPVFTSISHLNHFKTKLNKGEFIYISDKMDLLDFLNRNNKVAAAVINPMEDDLLLYRMQLQNMIRIGADQNSLF